MEESGKLRRRGRQSLPWAVAETLFLGLFLLGLCLAARRGSVRWCTTSKQEARKCSKFQQNLRKERGPSISCIRKDSPTECIKAIAVSQQVPYVGRGQMEWKGRERNG